MFSEMWKYMLIFNVKWKQKQLCKTDVIKMWKMWKSACRKRKSGTDQNCHTWIADNFWV